MLALVLALIAWMWAGSAIALDEDSADASDVEVTEASTEAKPAEEPAAKQAPAEEPAPALEEAADPVAEPAPAPAAPESEAVEEDPEVAPLGTPNPDGLPGPVILDQGDPVNYNIYPETSFGKPAKRAKRSLMSTQATEEFKPGDVRVSKTAKPVPGEINQWDVTLTIEGYDEAETTDIVLVIDTSNSMEGTRIASAKSAANAFVDELLPSPNRRIGVVSYGDEASIDQALTSNQNELHSAINGLYTYGGTFTQAGIRQAQALLDNSKATNKYMVVLSDGEPTYSYAIKDFTNQEPPAVEVFDSVEHGWFLTYYDYYMQNSADLPTDIYDTTTVVGNGQDGLTYLKRTKDGRDRYYWYYNHGNSAIAEAGFAKNANPGTTIYSVGLQMSDYGQQIMDGIASPGNSYTADPDSLSTIFTNIASDIGAAVRNAQVTDPMGTGFDIYGDVSDISASQGKYEYKDKTLNWNPGNLTKPRPATSENPNPDPNIKYAELKYRVTIDDDILKATPDENGNVPTNGDAKVSYTDVNGKPATKNFVSPKVNPLVYTIDKVLYNQSGDQVLEGEFTADVKDPNGDPTTYKLSAAQNSARVITGLKSGEYTFAETGDIDKYSVKYLVKYANDNKEFESQDFSVSADKNTKDLVDATVTVVNRPATGKLTITKIFSDNLTEAISKTNADVNFSGTYTCKINENVTSKGTWQTNKAGLATITKVEGSEPTAIPVNSTCSVTEDTMTGLPEAFYTWNSSVGAEATITKGQDANVDVTNDVAEKAGTAVWTKVDDKEDGKVLSGSEWKLTGPSYPDGKQIVDCVSGTCAGPDKNPNPGEFSIEGLKWGKYELVETLAPSGYIVDSKVHEFTIGYEDQKSTLTVKVGEDGKITNTKVEGPSIPLTGGISRDAYLYGGLLTLGVGLAVTGAFAIRRKADM